MARAGRQFLLRPNRPQHRPERLPIVPVVTGVPSGSVAEPILIKMTAKLQQIGSPDLAHVQRIRGLLNTRVAMPTPAIVQGRPVIPYVWVTPTSTLTPNVGASHIRVMDPPQPDPPHPSGSGSKIYYTWTAEDLADPPGNHGFYSLSSWPEKNGGPAWTSSGDYRPRVADYVVYGAENAYHTYTRCVHFDATSVQHMWVDLSNHNQPFTWVLCGLIHYYPEETYGHYLLDAGLPTPAYDVTEDTVFNENMNYRSLMLYQHSSAVLATHIGADAVANGKHVKAPHNDIARPRVFIGLFNGNYSWIGSYDLYNQYGMNGKIDSKNHRYFVMGRRQNNVSSNLAAHMTMFEVRFFNKALTKTERFSQYRQLSSKWRFNKYGSGL